MSRNDLSFSEDISRQFENAAFPFWIVDKKLDIIYFNKQAEIMYPSSRLLDGLRILLSPLDCEEIVRLIAIGDSFNNSPSAISVFPAITMSFSPYNGSDGQPAGAYVVLAPLVEQPDNILDLRQSLLSASSLVITREFKKSVSEILYSLSACVTKLKNAQVNIIDDQIRKINHSCYQIMRSTSNVSERIHYASNIQPAMQCVDFWDNCAELLEACSTVLRSCQASFSYELPDSTVYVTCDFEKVSVAILHLLSNAYLHCGKDIQVTVTGWDSSDGIMLTVSDNGTGIPDEIQDAIFQPFSWGSTAHQDTGMGLGLNIVRNIISQAGGKMAMNSGDEGTTLVLSLPRADPPSAPPELCSTSAVYMQDRFSALYVILCDVVTPPDP